MDYETETLWEDFKHLLDSDHPLIQLDCSSATFAISTILPSKLPEEIFKGLGNYAASELSRGNLLRKFSLRLSQSSFIEIHFLKLSEPLKHILKDSLLPYKLVEINHSGQPGQLTKVKVEPTTSTGGIIGSILERPFPKTNKPRPDELKVRDGFRIIFSRDAEASLEYILNADEPKRNNFLYVEGDQIQVLNTFKKVLATMKFSFGKLKYKELELKWSDLDNCCIKNLLETKFEIQNEDYLKEILNATKKSCMVNGNLLLALLHNGKPFYSLLADANIFVEGNEWLKICPAKRTVKSRNHFTFGMFTDSVLSGSQIELITDEINKPGGSFQSNPLILDRMDSPNKSGDKKTVHKFEVLEGEGGEFEYHSNYPNPYPEWELKKSPVFKWLSTSPPEKFEQLQLLLMKQRVHSDPESEQVLLLPSSTPNPSRRHCILSGESGIGKTTMLHVLAARLLDQHLTTPNENTVVFLNFRNVINSLQPNSQINQHNLNQAIIESAKGSLTMLKDDVFIRLNENLSTFVKNGIRSSNPTYLILDGMDHIGFENLEKGFQVVELIEKEFPNVSLYVTARPNLVLRLEFMLTTFAVTLEGLEDHGQLRLLTNSFLNTCFNFGIGHPLQAEHLQNPLQNPYHGVDSLETANVPQEVEEEEYEAEEYEGEAEEYEGEAEEYVANPPPTHRREHLQVGGTYLPSYVQQMGSYVKTMIRYKLSRFGNSDFLNQTPGLSAKVVFRAGVRHYAVGLMCPGFELVPGYCTIALGGITKQQLEGSGLHPFPSEAISLVPGRVAEFIIAELLKELLKNSQQNAAAFELLIVFLKTYYLLDISKISVYDIHSVYRSRELQANLHFTNVYSILDAMLEGQWVPHSFLPSHMRVTDSPTPRLPQIPPEFLLSAVYYGYPNIFKFLCDSDDPPSLKDDSKFVEFVIASDQCDQVATSKILSPGGANFDTEITALINMLAFQAKTKNGMFWSANSVYGKLFEGTHPGYVERIIQFLTSLIKAEQRRGGNQKIESHLVSQMFRLVSNSNTIELTLPVRNFLEFLLSIDPTAANGIYREDYLTSFRFLLTELKISPSHFSHQNPIFGDIYRLFANFPAKPELKECKKELLKSIESGLKAYNFDESKWLSQTKKWYAKLYDQFLDKFYKLWLHKHEDWWAKEEESLSKDVFLRGCASLALSIRFPERKASSDFRLQTPNKFVEMLTKTGLLGKCKTTCKVLFFHPGICDYLIAWMIANVWFSVDHKVFTKFFMGSIMTTISPSGEGPSQVEMRNSSNFKNFLVCYFLDELVNVRSKTGVILQRGTEACKMDNSWDITGFENILQSCYDKKFYNVLNLFAKESYYEGRILKGEIMRALLFQVLENICRPLVNFAITLIKSADKLGLLTEIRSGNGENIVDVARRTCKQTPFEKEIMECFASSN